MKTLAEHMVSYGAYHRDARNRATHFVGVPLIMFALLIALAWLRWPLAGVELSVAMLFTLAVVLYYLKLDRGLGLAMAAFSGLLLALAEWVAGLPFTSSLAVFLPAFIGGWIIQFIGHVFEGRRPALFDNLFQAIVAPIFLMAEVFFALGLKRDLQRAVSGRLARPGHSHG